MKIGRDDRIRMERAHVLAWPALRTADIGGWLWRCSGGGSQRANSVSTIDFHYADAAAAIAAVESRYHAERAVARFQTFNETSPSGLADLLQDRGYVQGEPTMTMFKRPQTCPAVAEVEAAEHAGDEWRDVYMGGITEDRRASNALILDRIAAPRAFFGCRREGQLVSTALGVAGFGCAVIECVMTSAHTRRQGAARTTMMALEHWATRQGVDWIGLQVVAANTPAIRLYEQLGFTSGAVNRFWVSPNLG